ncbi:uncharacterized protein M6B38_207385 [Iris pallida]|uniref:Transmembrane protein n=1 Tax=Iris pallida TaxID=29817 RepID=A0AAX6E5P0_IRIPA|nr:uncharacterized protein M6B38_207385 [Iris pallida]
MHFTTGSSARSWHPVMTADTNNPHYWLNWRFLLCSVWVLACVIVSSVLIWRYEGRGRGRTERDSRQGLTGTLYDDESWRTCLKVVHPAWLLGFRVVSFFVLLALLLLNAVAEGGDIFYYYTQWTFMLLTIYFALGSLLSSYGCLQYLGMMGGQRDTRIRSDTECGTYASPTNANESNVAPTNGNADENGRTKNSDSHEEDIIREVSAVSREEYNVRKVAEFWGYAFQIIYQTNAGAVMLTDCVFWFIIFPFLARKDYDLNPILIGMHSVNAILLLGDTALNNLRFPWFRISYFLLWTSGFVIFQWIVHACTSIWWPYPFLDLSSPRAPIWYLVVALMHIPCYAIFPLIMKMKHILLSRYFPQYFSVN